jgi:CTD small phosphatase-like protein 2
MCSLFQIHQESDLQGGQGLLPKRDANDDRKTLVLDMDETLVHCSFQDEPNTPCDWKFTLESGRSMTDVFCWVRPNLEEFLRAASKMYEIVVFTAGQELYANKVLDLIDPTGYIEHRLFRQHCTQVNGNFVKDLSLLGRQLRNTAIIDNSPISFAFQPMNGILCDDWLGNPKDCELLQLIPTLQLLDSSRDVRAKLWEISYVGHFLFDLCEALSENEESWRMREEGAGSLNDGFNS